MDTTKGLNILAQFTNKKESETLNKLLQKNFLNDYEWALYQTIDLLQNMSFKEVKKIIEEKQLCWNHSCFLEHEKRLKDHDEYILQPFEVVDGVVKCPKCGSHRTLTHQKQTRRADETATTFSCCVVCRFQWRYSG